VNNLFDEDFNDPTYGGGYENPGPSAGDYAGDAAYYAKEGAAVAKQGVKKLIPIIVLAVIALVVIGFVISFLGSQQTINFTIRELDDKTVTGARLSVKDSSGNELLGKSGSNHTLTLGPGNYNIRVSSGEYKSFSDTLKIPRLSGSERDDDYTINLKKNLEGALEITLDATEIYEKQILIGQIKITNTGDAMTDEEMLVDSDTSSDLEDDINFSPTVFGVSSGGTRIIDFTMTLDKDISATKEDEIIKFRIKGTDISKERKINLVPAIPKNDIILSGDIDDGIIKDHQLVSGEQEDMAFDIKNDDRTLPLKNITITIEADDIESEENLDWFEFAESVSDKQTATIGSISPREKETLTLKVTPSIDAKIGEKFKGKMKIESFGIQEREILVNLDFMVKEEKQSRLTFDVSDLSTDCYTSMAPCKPVQTLGKIKVENTGDAPIGPILIAWDTGAGASDYCDHWIDFATYSISSLAVDAEKVLAFDLTIPDGETAPFTSCYLKATYEDPLTGKTNVDPSEPFQIKITIKESP
jgi:hypothetical protein